MQENSIIMRDAVQRLQDFMVTLPQVTLETRHYFLPGMYCREVFIPAGLAVIGKLHKKEHFYMMTKGKLRMLSEFGPVYIEAPLIVACKPDVKRVLYAMEDSIFITVHRTDKTDLTEIEKELMGDDPQAQFDAYNMPKPGVLEHKP